MKGASWERSPRAAHGRPKRRGVVVPRVTPQAEPPPPVCFLCRILSGRDDATCHVPVIVDDPVTTPLTREQRMEAIRFLVNRQ